jgi:hypothetical protein
MAYLLNGFLIRLSGLLPTTSSGTLTVYSSLTGWSIKSRDIQKLFECRYSKMGSRIAAPIPIVRRGSTGASIMAGGMTPKATTDSVTTRLIPIAPVQYPSSRSNGQPQ